MQGVDLQRFVYRTDTLDDQDFTLLHLSAQSPGHGDGGLAVCARRIAAQMRGALSQGSGDYRPLGETLGGRHCQMLGIEALRAFVDRLVHLGGGRKENQEPKA